MTKLQQMKIKPCPWCGCRGLEKHWFDGIGDYYRIVCRNLMCGAGGPLRRSTDAAIDVWNRAERKSAKKATVKNG